jgi:hypothetical protein
MSHRRLFAVISAARGTVSCALLGACSIASAADLFGKWAGMWEDDGSGHAGPLKAHLARKCDGSYHCRFHGRFMKIIPSCYKTDLEVVCEDGCTTHMQGTSRIPILATFTIAPSQPIATSCSISARSVTAASSRWTV